MQLFTALLSALALISSTTALPAPAVPVRRSEDIVVSPSIFEPAAGASWQISTTQYVKWQTSNIPQSARNYTGSIVLGFDDGTGSENLDYENPLAHGFLLTSGGHPVTVPNVSPNNTYFVVLFGDSGNKSPHFTITH
ncbi:hypothetical protein DFH94DRAFT_221890 [Russula ochroleuca]|jgi:hypothetical protein|uniref:Uncharacterized protein n=1 Tax=Russula ochroleuca TaxID=152965 RepID=A0A9P5MLZ2_9AGAM|nr:hypothetical protein DFH94DRAFT_221890 [Russula ochroleuca]